MVGTPKPELEDGRSGPSLVFRPAPYQPLIDSDPQPSALPLINC